MNSQHFYRRPEPRVVAPQLALRPREAAAAIGVSPSTLERLTKAGEISFVPAGRCRLYLVGDLEAFLTSRRTTAEKAAPKFLGAQTVFSWYTDQLAPVTGRAHS
jgi:excisionase family DNA binding protein